MDMGFVDTLMGLLQKAAMVLQEVLFSDVSGDAVSAEDLLRIMRLGYQQLCHMAQGRDDIKAQLVPHVHTMLVHQGFDVQSEAVLLLVLQDNKDVLNHLKVLLGAFCECVGLGVHVRV